MASLEFGHADDLSDLTQMKISFDLFHIGIASFSLKCGYAGVSSNVTAMKISLDIFFIAMACF